MKKLLNACLIITSLFGYLEWGKDMHAFLFRVEYDLFAKVADNSATTFLHPFVLLPLGGQLLLLFTLFQKAPSKILTIIGLSCLSLLMLLILFIGILTMNIKIAGSALPFVIVGILVLRAHRRLR